VEKGLAVFGHENRIHFALVRFRFSAPDMFGWLGTVVASIDEFNGRQKLLRFIR
jgi:hypothetical protein